MSGTDPLLEELIDGLETMAIDAVRQVWRDQFREDPPALQSGDVLRRCLADALQRRAAGRDPDLERRLAKLVNARGRGETLTPRARYSAGTMLTRDHDGVEHRVEVLNDGFAWRGQNWRSLSEIAREITGVRWNGPRFFGLREPSPSGGARP